MLAKLRPRSVYDVLAAIGCFAALTTGVAYAAETIGSDDVINESLLSEDIKNGTVAAGDIREGTIGSGRIADNSLGSVDIRNDTLAGEDINESTLDLGAAFNASAANGGCTADSAVHNCATTTVTLGRPGRLLAVATGEWKVFRLDDDAGVGADVDDPKRVTGSCHIRFNGAVPATHTPQTMGEQHPVEGEPPAHPDTAPGTLSLTALSGTLDGGTHTVTVACAEVDADLDWSKVNLTAAVVDR
jgi:hypothetical protein